MTNLITILGMSLLLVMGGIAAFRAQQRQKVARLPGIDIDRHHAFVERLMNGFVILVVALLFLKVLVI